MLPPRALHILLVEDHADTAKVTVRLLNRSGFVVDHAGSCDAARTAAQSKNFDLIICDLGLGDGDACELFKELRGRYGLTGIVYSGSDKPEDFERCKAAGFHSQLVKPVPFPTLFSAITDAVGSAKLPDVSADHSDHEGPRL